MKLWYITEKMDITRDLIASKPRQMEKHIDHFTFFHRHNLNLKWYLCVYMCGFICMYIYIWAMKLGKVLCELSQNYQEWGKISGIMGYLYALGSINR